MKIIIFIGMLLSIISISIFARTLDTSISIVQFRILTSEEAMMVYGKGSSFGLFYTPSSPSTPITPQKVNIVLRNIPYISQYIFDNNRVIEPRSYHYCGLASALMVRNKNIINGILLILYNDSQDSNIVNINNDLKKMDNHLKKGNYGSNYQSNQKVDVAEDRYNYKVGLMYTNNNETIITQLNRTIDIVKYVYKGIIYNSQSDTIYDQKHVFDVSISYGGIATGEWTNFIQMNQETCGHAVASFLLTSIGLPDTEAALISEVGNASMLSFADMNVIFTSRGLKTQMLNIEPAYFKKYPTTAILHFSRLHYVVFIQEESGDPEIFDPTYGQVFVPWKILLRLFSGNMLYVYQ